MPGRYLALISKEMYAHAFYILSDTINLAFLRWNSENKMYWRMRSWCLQNRLNKILHSKLIYHYHFFV